MSWHGAQPQIRESVDKPKTTTADRSDAKDNHQPSKIAQNVESPRKATADMKSRRKNLMERYQTAPISEATETSPMRVKHINLYDDIWAIKQTYHPDGPAAFMLLNTFNKLKEKERKKCKSNGNDKQKHELNSIDWLDNHTKSHLIDKQRSEK